MQVTVCYEQPKTYSMTPVRKKLCKTIARGSYRALAMRCLENENIRTHIVDGIGRMIRKEVAKLCSNGANSILCDKSNGTLQSFQWKQLEDELETHSTTLFNILKKCTKNSSQKRSLIGVIAAIMCKHRRGSASLIQRLVSIILYSGHASKNVSELTNINSTLSYLVYTWFSPSTCLSYLVYTHRYL